MIEHNGIVIHCSDSPQGRGDDASTIDRWHKERGWSGIGYHYVILEDGTIQCGRPLGKTGAHAKGHNNKIGICLIGQTVFTDAQFLSLEVLTKGLANQYNIEPKDILGHYMVSSKTCPNFDVDTFKRERNIV